MDILSNLFGNRINSQQLAVLKTVLVKLGLRNEVDELFQSGWSWLKGIRPVDSDGHLYKRGAHSLQSWNQRYYILKEGKLTFYEQGEKDSFTGWDLKGSLELFQYSGASLSSELEITLASSNSYVKEYILGFDTMSTRDKFCENLVAHIQYATEQHLLMTSIPFKEEVERVLCMRFLNF